MGGVSFILASIITGFLGCIYIIVVDGITVTLPFMFTLAFAVAAGIIGCIDDSAKLKKKQNEGLTALQKYALQFLVSGIYLVAMTIVCRRFSTMMFIPFLGKSVDFGVFYYSICMILLTGFLNAVIHSEQPAHSHHTGHRVHNRDPFRYPAGTVFQDHSREEAVQDEPDTPSF